MIKRNVLPYVVTIVNILIITIILCSCSSSSSQPSNSAQSNNTSRRSIQTKTLAEKITDEENTLIYTISCTYPVIAPIKKDDVAEKLNAAFKKDAEEFIAKTKESEDIERAKNTANLAKKSKKEFYPHSSSINYILQYNNNNIVSFLKAREDYTGGTSRTYYSEGETYNLETGSKFDLSEVFEAKNLGLIKILQNGFKSELSGNKEIFKDKTDFSEEEITNNMNNLKWYLSSNGIVFFFNPNTIVPNTNEILQFTYNYTKNKSMFKISIS